MSVTLSSESFAEEIANVAEDNEEEVREVCREEDVEWRLDFIYVDRLVRVPL